MRKLKNYNGMYINLERLKKFKPREPYNFHLADIKHRATVIGRCQGIAICGLGVLIGWLISLL